MSSRLIDALAPGARVFVPTLSNESALLAEELAADPERARGVTFAGVQFPGIDRADYLALHPEARQTAFFMSPTVRRGLSEGRAELLAFDYAGIARYLASGDAFDVAVAQLTPPDDDGWCSAGLVADFMPLVWPRARRRVAHLNPALPRTRGTFRAHIDEIEIAIEREATLLDPAEARPGIVEARIAARAAALVRDGDTLQFGVGGVPSALGHALADHRRLRIHSGLVAAWLRTLWDGGAIDRDARIATGVVLGDATLRDFVRGLEPLWLTDVTQTHAAAPIAAATTGSRFVGINGALEVDLFGQVNAERTGGTVQAGAGGLPAFAQAALTVADSRLLVCLRATSKQGGVSRIVPALGDTGLCTLPRHLADAIVTEHGTAELRGLGLDARAEALIAIAAPEHRAALASAWQRMRAAL